MPEPSTSFRMRPDVHDKLRVLAAYEDRSLNNMLKNLIEQEYIRLDREIGTEDLDALYDDVIRA